METLPNSVQSNGTRLAAAQVEPGLLLAQGRVLEMVADGSVLGGTAADLARRFGVKTSELLAAVDELAGIGWLELGIEQDGRLIVRWTG